MVGVGVREDGGVDDVDLLAHELQPQLGGRVDDEVPLGGGNEDADAGAVVLRVGRRADRTMAADDRHADARRRAENDQLSTLCGEVHAIGQFGSGCLSDALVQDKPIRRRFPRRHTVGPVRCGNLGPPYSTSSKVRINIQLLPLILPPLLPCGRIGPEVAPCEFLQVTETLRCTLLPCPLVMPTLGKRALEASNQQFLRKHSQFKFSLWNREERKPKKFPVSVFVNGRECGQPGSMVGRRLPSRACPTLRELQLRHVSAALAEVNGARRTSCHTSHTPTSRLGTVRTPR